ncbi:hypothetical protein C8F01DRAFT_1001792, partial [Mycena amicta]
GSLPTEYRPKQVYHWVKNRRIAKPAYCAVGNTVTYGNHWWKWWANMQPDWRGSVDGTPGDGEVHGSWDGLYVSGVNGMLNVVASLYWWGREEKVLGDEPSMEWIQATEDVAWVLKCVHADVEVDKLG